MALDPASRVRVNLEHASVLLLDESPIGMSILVQVMSGLGARTFHRCESIWEAREVATTCEIDLAIVDAIAPSGAGYEFVHWLRRQAGEPNCYVPVIVTTSHTPSKDVTRGRDCGGHAIIKKPIAPVVLLERILWASKGGRSFLLSDGYVGPDRRFRDRGAPGGVDRRKGETEDSVALLDDEPQARRA